MHTLRAVKLRRRSRVLHAAFALVLALPFATQPAHAAQRTVEPRLRFQPGAQAKLVALTFDACSGAFDGRIADVLVKNNIPATIFVTDRWLKRNGPALALLLGHRDLFEIEDHGEHHIPAVTGTVAVFGLKPAGTLKAVDAEVEDGADAVRAATGQAPRWFRGATARYSPDAMAEIKADGFRIAGFSLNADMGAALPGRLVAKRIAAAKPGDVIIAHINQPSHPAGAGVAEGILALKAEGFHFKRLDEAFAP